MKERKDWTFEELVDWATGHILQELLKGKFRSGVFVAFDVCLMWKQDRDKKKGKS